MLKQVKAPMTQRAWQWISLVIVLTMAGLFGWLVGEWVAGPVAGFGAVVVGIAVYDWRNFAMGCRYTYARHPVVFCIWLGLFGAAMVACAWRFGWWGPLAVVGAVSLSCVPFAVVQGIKARREQREQDRRLIVMEMTMNDVIGRVLKT
jgi:hypothetical protein